MARRISYKFKDHAKEINFANDKYHDMYEAIKNFRDQEFAKFGFSDIQFIKDDPKAK